MDEGLRNDGQYRSERIGADIDVLKMRLGIQCTVKARHTILREIDRLQRVRRGEISDPKYDFLD